MEIKVVKKVKKSNLKIVKGELKQYQTRFFFFFRPWKLMFKPGRKSINFFQLLFPNYIQVFKKMIEDDLA